MHICSARSAQRCASFGQAVDEIGMDVALAQHAGAFGGDAEQVAGARLDRPS